MEVLSVGVPYKNAWNGQTKRCKNCGTTSHFTLQDLIFKNYLYSAYCENCEESVITLNERQIPKDLLKETRMNAIRNRLRMSEGFWTKAAVARELIEGRRFWLFALVLAASPILMICGAALFNPPLFLIGLLLLLWAILE